MTRQTLMLATVLGLALVGGSLSAQPKEPILPQGGWPKSATGLGETELKAKENAYKAAVKVISNLMMLQNPPLQSFEVSEAYVRKYLLTDAEKPGEDEEIEIKGEKLTFKVWVVSFKTDHTWWHDIVRRDNEEVRKARAQERETLASRVMLGLATLLIAGFGYVRLDEFTQRRYTIWLRLAGVGLVTTALAGAWWVVHG